jgi:hypothetical protein
MKKLIIAELLCALPLLAQSNSGELRFKGSPALTIAEVRKLLLRSPLLKGLSDHFKSGQRLSLQNRPTEVAVRD